ncbi:related to tetracycline resistance from transposon Tn4351 Tn4400 [Lecanosticta acicola]|uniref:Related to tetracycline resistance from transposon Tn4351 Tn4400 n=1 Tax=Lecanosticta acicola TaxID=111012 RepID=A0AAI8YTB1_9PEZI|nr:related to tetracycline resistance from transposon Tn4351 Tn4400 [Lecanosticta acicola]
MTRTQPPIAICGAGPGGLMCARILELAKIPYVVFERDESATWADGRGGSGCLDIHPDSGQLALREAGLFDQFKAVARFDATNRPEMDRKDLRRILLRSVPQHNIRWGCKIQEVKKDRDGSMTVHLADGRIESGFRLVIGADGAWSKARQLISPAKPQYQGVHFLTTSMSPRNEHYACASSLAGKGNYLAFGDAKNIICMKLGDGSYYVAFGTWLPENWVEENPVLAKDPTALRQWILDEHLADWPAVHRDLIKYSDANFRPWKLVSMPTDAIPWKTVPGVTLLGDAAHCTVPNGEGVNHALYDGYLLADQIIKRGLDDLGGAVEEYEKLMFPRGIEQARSGPTVMKMMLDEGAPHSLIRFMMGPEQDARTAPLAE